MKSKLSLPALLLRFTIWLTCLGAAHAQTVMPNNPAQSQLEVIGTNGAGKETHGSSINGVAPMVMVRQNQTVPITLQFPTETAGTPIAISVLDGGTIRGGTPAILPTGKFVFTFSPGAVPGRYRVLVQTPSEQHVLPFYVVDPANPSSRPRSVR